jgi:hypothetical protein
MSQLQQVIVMLPEPLVAFLKRAATREDRTLSGVLRHLVSEAARTEPPPQTGFSDAFAPPVPSVPATVEGIAAAKERLAKLRHEQAQIRRRKARWQTTVDEDTRIDRLVAEIEIMGKQIAMAERFVKPGANGGTNV